MAEEEKNTKPPALVDYYGDPDEQTDNWTPANFKSYWSRRLVTVHKMSALPWTVKDHTLWKRLVDQFQPEALVGMIDHWMQVSPKPSDFTGFYMNREKLHGTVNKKDYEWE